jgi:N-acetylneuraminic acid mutarotase
MYRTSIKGRMWLTVAVLLAAMGCGSPRSTTSSVQLTAVLAQAASAEAVTRVVVTVMAADMDTVTGSLTKTGGTWGGTLDNVPAGTGRTFIAEAFDASGVKRFAGEARDVTLTAGQTAVVAITLQDLDPKPGFDNDVPVITSLVASSSHVLPGGTITLRATATDPDPGDTLTFAWTAPAGGFDAPSSASTTWTAPLASGSVTLTLAVTDSRGAVAALGLTVLVEGAGDGGTGGGTDGGFSVSAVLNTWPQVTRMNASPSYVAPGESTELTAAVTDSDGDSSFSYEWTSECPGTWLSPSSSTARFTPEGPGTSFSGGCGRCAVSVRVRDGRGGEATGTLRLCVGSKPTATFPPRISGTFQSSLVAAPGGTVTLRVTVTGTDGQPLRFDWVAGNGALGRPLNTISASELVWTAPSCLPASGPTVNVTATVRNAAGLSSTASFPVTLTGGAACPASGWAETGSLAEGRIFHTATLLSSGKVLVAGGFGRIGSGGAAITPSVELFDPAARAWSTVTPMSLPRYVHTATLLPSGKVLVAGGLSPMGSSGPFAPVSSTELYDPVDNTWSAAAPMSSPRVGHTATLLPSGKVLVVGGTGDNHTPLATAELYDPATNTWTPAGSMGVSRLAHAAALLSSGKVLVTGGRTSSITATAEVYDPVSGSWSPTGGMSLTRMDHMTAVLHSGRVLAAGGITNWEMSMNAVVEQYDPMAGTWSTTGPLALARRNEVVVALPSGKALVIGGEYAGPGGDGFSVGAAELYEPVMETWSSAGEMFLPRSLHTATVLPSGQVLVVGGLSSFRDWALLTSAELYTP